MTADGTFTVGRITFGPTTFTRSVGTGPGPVQFVTQGEFSAFGGTMTVNLNGGTGTVKVGDPGFFSTATQTPTLMFGSQTATGLTDFQNGIDLNGNGLIASAIDNPNSTTDAARISGVISNTGSAATAAFLVNTFSAAGVVELTAANTLNAPVGVSRGTLKLTGTGSFANSPIILVSGPPASTPAATLDVSGLTGGANFANGRFQVAPNQTLEGLGTVVGDVGVGPGGTIRGGSRNITPVTAANATGVLTVSGSDRLAAAGTLGIDLNGATATGATVGRVAATDTWDFAPQGGGKPVLRLLNDQSLTRGQSYTFTVASAAGGYTLNGTPVTSYAYGTDFDLASNTFAGFLGVSLADDGTAFHNLLLTFTPVPERERPGRWGGRAGVSRVGPPTAGGRYDGTRRIAAPQSARRRHSPIYRGRPGRKRTGGGPASLRGPPPGRRSSGN